MNLKTYKTNKLFYKKYLYKISFNLVVGDIFRSNYQRIDKLGYATKKIEQYKETLKHNSYIEQGRYKKIRFGNAEVSDAESFKDFLLTSADYMLRQEYTSTIVIYTTEKTQALALLLSLNTVTDLKLWEPEESAKSKLLLDPTLLVSKLASEFEFKVTINVGAIREKNSPLITWIAANRDKIRITEYALKHAYSYVSVYVRDEKILLLLQMTGQNFVTKIERLVLPAQLDK